ncbi:MAG: oligosaccharide flippase family protein [Proteobacteria bacterium]|nr:oligosaccharide flippase family protein [Pseudomonadota bacterium]
MLGAWRERIAAKLPKNRVARGIITLASGTAIAQVVTICAMPIVTRLYTPAQIGVISLFLAYFGFWAATLSLRYEFALLICKDDAESHLVYRLAVISVVVMSLLGIPVLWMLRWAGVLGFGLLPEWAPLAAAPILLGYGLFMVNRSWALRAGIINEITSASVARSIATAGARILLGAMGGGVFALFAAELGGAWGAMLRLLRKVHANYSKSRPEKITRHDLMSVAKRYIKFPTLETPSSWLNQLTLALPLPIIASTHGVTAAGWFGLARSLVAIPNTQIGGAVADVLQMEIAHALRKNAVHDARKLFYGLMRRLALFGLVPMIAAVVLAPSLMSVIFGSKWAPAGMAAAIIAPWFYIALVVSALSRVLSVFQAQEYKFIYDILSVSSMAVVYEYGQSTGTSLMMLIFWLSIAGIISYLIYLYLIVKVVNKRLRNADGHRT